MRTTSQNLIAAAGLFSLLGVASAQSVSPVLAPEPDAEPLVLLDPPEGCGKACILRAVYEAQKAAGMDMSASGPGSLIPGRLNPGRRGDRGAATDPTDVLNYDLSLEVAPPSLALTGRNDITLRATQNNVTSFTFVLRWNYTVTSCTVTDAQGTYTVSPTVPATGGTSYARTFTFLRPLNTNDTATVSINYSGNIATGIGFSPGSVVVTTQRGVAGAPPVLCTLSQPYYAATWWPAKDGDVRLPGDNSDKATFSISITCPSALSAVSNGLLQSTETLTGSRRKFTYRTNYQMAPYLAFISVSQYNQWQTTYSYPSGQSYPGGPTYPAGSMPLQFAIYPSADNPTNRGLWERSADILEAFRPIFGLYPFINEKYGKYQFEFSGGMEHQTMSGQGGSGGTPFAEWLSAHELAHQWFGDDVTCKTWNDIWLNEGFATLSQALWEERKPESTGAPAYRAAMNNLRPSNPAGSVYVTNTTSVGAIFNYATTYAKSAWVLHMLRGILGDAAFFGAIQTYRAQFSGGAPTTSDFINSIQTTTGRDLSWFFTPWVFGQGAPAYTYSWQNATIDGNPYLRLRIDQSNTSSLPTVFANPIPVRVTTATLGTVNLTAYNDAASDYFLFPLPAGVSAGGVELDPDNWVLEYGKTAATYVQGPPKLVSASPAPSATLPAAPGTLRLSFSDNVTITPADIAVTRGGTPVPFTLSYSPTNWVATLTFTSTLQPGTYSVAVSDNITSVFGGGIRLDGEITATPVSPATPPTLPSGNGQPGGIAAFTFTIQPCAADFNNSGSATVQDIFDYLNAYFAGSLTADTNNSGDLSVQDLFDFLSLYFQGCV